MNLTIGTLGWMVLGVVLAGPAVAQQTPATPAAGKSAQSEAGEPRADTSAPAPAGAPASAAKTVPAASASHDSTDPTSPRPAPAAGDKAGAKVDRLDLGTATVTGDREQPKVMYIVPWKRSDIGDLTGRPMNSLVDEILAPVDRDVFKREVIYYHALQSDAAKNAASQQPAPQGEK